LSKLAACNCLTVCYLFSYCTLFAQNVSQTAPALGAETVELRPVTITDLTATNGSGIAAEPEETQPAAEPQGQGDGSGNGNGNPNGSGGGSANVGGASVSGNAPALTPAATPYMFPSTGEIGQYWLRNMLGAKAFLGATISASFDTWVNTTPSKWGHRRGWGKRFGVSLLDNAMDESALNLLSLATKQDPMYYPCGCSGVWRRAKHAIKLSFTGRNFSGDYVFSPAKIVSPFVGPMVTRTTIYPYGYKASDGARGGAYNLAGDIGWNLFREFIFNIGHVIK
jgi:hypothetical protein